MDAMVRASPLTAAGPVGGAAPLAAFSSSIDVPASRTARAGDADQRSPGEPDAARVLWPQPLSQSAPVASFFPPVPPFGPVVPATAAPQTAASRLRRAGDVPLFAAGACSPKSPLSPLTSTSTPVLFSAGSPPTALRSASSGSVSPPTPPHSLPAEPLMPCASERRARAASCSSVLLGGGGAAASAAVSASHASPHAVALVDYTLQPPCDGVFTHMALRGGAQPDHAGPSASATPVTVTAAAGGSSAPVGWPPQAPPYGLISSSSSSSSSTSDASSFRSPARRSTICTTPSRSMRLPLGSPQASPAMLALSPPSAGFDHLASLHLPPPPDTVLTLRRVVELYLKAVALKRSTISSQALAADVGAAAAGSAAAAHPASALASHAPTPVLHASAATTLAPAPTPTPGPAPTRAPAPALLSAPLSADASHDVLATLVMSPSWRVGAVAMLARTQAMFAECCGPAHASVASTEKLRGCLHAQLGEHEAAAAHFTSALTLCEADVSVPPLATAGVRYNLGVCWLALGEFARAVPCFRAVVGAYTSRLGPGHEATVAAGDKLLQAQRSGMQLQYTHLYTAGLKAQASGEHAVAHAAFEQCLTLVPEDPQIAFALCCCCCRLGCCDGGMQWFRAAVAWGYEGVRRACADPELAALRVRPEFQALVGGLLAEGGEEEDGDVTDEDMG